MKREREICDAVCNSNFTSSIRPVWFERDHTFNLTGASENRICPFHSGAINVRARARVLVPAQSASFENCYKIPRNPLCTRKMVNEKKWLEDKWKVKITSRYCAFVLDE